MVDQAVTDGVAMLRDAVDALLGAPVDGLDPAALIDVFGAVEVQRNRLAAVDQRLIAALGSTGAVLGSGATSLPDLVSSVTRCSRGAARARVERSVDLGPRHTVTGEPLEPIHPLLAGAVAAGTVSEEQCRVIVSELGRIGPDAEAHAFEIAEQFLVRAAQVETPAALARSAKWVLAQLDPAGLEPVETTAERGRTFHLAERADADGLVTGRCRLTAETAAALRTVLDALASPRPTNEAGERDDRGPGQRRHDALLEMALRLLRSGDLPDSGGVTTSVVVQLRARADLDNAGAAGGDAAAGRSATGDARTDEARTGGGGNEDTPTGDVATGDVATGDVATGDVATGDVATRGVAAGGAAGDAPAATGGVGALLARLSGAGQFGDGGLISLTRLRPLFDECEITTVVLSATGGVLDYGRERRVATPAMRRALAARDGGCCFPGCTRPPAWCEAHHVWAWIDGGPTCLDNLCLLCAYHHRSFAAAGWRVRMRDGVPVWLPPAWLDTHRRALRNTARHLPRIDFGQQVAEVMRT